MPYGWQFKGENICIEAATGGKKLNCFGIITRNNEFSYKTGYFVEVGSSSLLVED